MKKLGTSITAYVQYYDRKLSDYKEIGFNQMGSDSDATKRQRLEVFLTLGIIRKSDREFIVQKNEFYAKTFLNIGHNKNALFHRLTEKFKLYKEYIEFSENEECDYFEYKDEHLLVEGIMIALLYSTDKKEKIENNYLKKEKSEIGAIGYYNLGIKDDDLIRLANSIIFPNEYNDSVITLKDSNSSKFDLSFVEVNKSMVNSEVYTFGKFTELLQNKNFEIKIPVYQREYLWTTDKAINLFSNIMEDSIVNLNAVTFKEVKKTQLENTLTVIDGQQRITTLLILLRSTYDATLSLIKTKEDNLENGSINTDPSEIRKLYGLYESLKKEFFTKDINGEIKLLNNYKRVEGDDTFERFYDVMNGTKSRFDKKNVNHSQENYTIIKKEIVNSHTSFNSIKKIIDNLLNKVYMTVIMDGTTNEMKLFETLNTTGIPLSTLDLMKCNLLSLIRPEVLFEHESSIQYLFHEKIASKIGTKKSDIEKFIRVYLRYHSKVKKEKTLFENFKSTIKAEDGSFNLTEISNEFDKIEKIVDIYNFINGTENEYSKYRIYDFTKTLDRDIYFPILINYIIELEDGKMSINEFRSIMFEFERFEIIFQICNYRGQSLSDKMDHILLQMKNIIQITKMDTRKILLADDTIRNSIKIKEHVFVNEIKKFAFSEKLVKKLLIRIVNYLHNDRKIDLLENDKLVDFKNITSEHIMPKDAKKWIAAKVVTQNEHISSVDKIGNFALLEEKLNKKISNDLFINKLSNLEGYTHLKYDLTLNKNGENGFDVLGLKVWNKKTIDERTEFLANLAGEIWSL